MVIVADWDIKHQFNRSKSCIMSPLRRGGGHIVFGVDPVGVGVGVGVGVAFCLHDIS